MKQAELFCSQNHVASYDELVKQVIIEINDIPYEEMLSGDRFLNFWEEFAFQVQIEESYCFVSFQETVRALCEGIVEELEGEALETLWKKSDACYEWDDEDEEPSIGDKRNGVTEELIQKVHDAAANYELPSYAVDDGTADKVIIYGRKSYQYDEAVEEIIQEIRNLPKSSMQSGDDSAYEDVWEEYASQIQDEESLFFELYVDLVESACYQLVRSRTKANLRRLWEETDSFFEWDEDEPEPDSTEMEEAVAQELVRRVNRAAADYELSEPDEDEDEDDDEYDDEECEEDTSSRFDLEDEDYGAIQVAKDVIHLFLSEKRLTELQVESLEDALGALERLPEVTPGIYCEYGICYRAGDESFREMRYITFSITEDAFEISTGGSVDYGAGSDSISGSGWRIEIGGFADRALRYELYDLENSIREYLNLGAEILVDDQSEGVDYEEERLDKNSEEKENGDSLYSSIEFYHHLKFKYKDYIKPEIVSVAMIQSANEVFLETLEIEIVEGGFEKQTKRRINLDFITDNDENKGQRPFFSPKDPIEKNVVKFINELTPISIINCTELFHAEACAKISKKYNTFGIDS